MTELQKVLYQYAQEQLVMGFLYQNRGEWQMAELAVKQAQKQLEALGPEAAARMRQLIDRQLDSFIFEQEAIFLSGLSIGLELGRG